MSDFRDGMRLAPGVYDYNGEMHVDIFEYIAACGGNAASEADRKMAFRAIAQVGAELGIEVTHEHDA